MKRTIYVAPATKISRSSLRASILAGSGDNGTFNGQSGAPVRGEDFTFESKRRMNETMD